MKCKYLFKFVDKDKLPKGWQGSCDAPNTKNPKIHVYKNLRGQNRLRKITHEILHALDWYKDEEWIEEASQLIAFFLWEIGYRGNPRLLKQILED